MKILCDVCRKEEAAIFCCADEAALCGPLAGKHCRLSLLHPASPEQSPLCDVCQEKTAFLFCQEDRAVLCRDCDSSIHSANDLTRKHTRFLLTGIKLSVSDAPAGLLPIAEVKDKNNSVYVPAVAEDSGEDTGSAASATSGSRISEYLMKELPGWHVEDLLLDTPSSGYGLPRSDLSDPGSFYPSSRRLRKNV
ncbi:unnamed protein product [Spirodela intermedia]|uniref:B box-type domain-containing protein n=1 Tax=Spirodela intermedia TaxID=51605 RepID=A0A7I8JBR2_SPIIN|nr:unnamed protein product [Spirodela intermedia]CAA6666913.1 unnamed protein product [Spirodela intermedia]